MAEIPIATDLRLAADLEREHIRRVLRATGGNKARAAKILGLDRRTLYRKASELEGAQGREEDRT